MIYLFIWNLKFVGKFKFYFIIKLEMFDKNLCLFKYFYCYSYIISEKVNVQLFNSLLMFFVCMCFNVFFFEEICLVFLIDFV